MNQHVDPKVATLAARLGVDPGGAEPATVLLAVVEALRRQGFVVVLKWDGERHPEVGDNGPYTAMLSRPGLDQLFFRRDDETLVGALEAVLREYETSHAG